jgi:uncharacterized protein YbjT (DUF2867 family)
VGVLREQAQPARAFVRLSSHYSELEQRGAEVFIGDLRQERDIIKACQDVQYVISAHGSNEASGSAQELDYRANIDLIDAAKANGVEHFVFISVLGVDRGYEDAPVFKAKRAVETYLQNSGLSYTILRPAGFAANLLPLAERFQQTGIYLLIGDAEARTSIVSTDDLAEIAAKSVSAPGAKNQVLPVGGPEILQRRDIPALFGRIFRSEPVIINPPLVAIDGLRSLVGFFNPEARRALGTFRTLLANEFYCTPAEVQRLEEIYAMRLETLETFIRRYISV